MIGKLEEMVLTPRVRERLRRSLESDFVVSRPNRTRADMRELEESTSAWMEQHFARKDSGAWIWLPIHVVVSFGLRPDKCLITFLGSIWSSVILNLIQDPSPAFPSWIPDRVRDDSLWVGS